VHNAHLVHPSSPARPPVVLYIQRYPLPAISESGHPLLCFTIAECISEAGPTVDITQLIGAAPGSSMYLGLSPLLCKWENLPPGMLNMCQKNACTACVNFSPNPSPADAAKAVAGVLPSGAGTAPTDFRYIIRSTYPDAPQCVAPLVCTAVDELGNAAYIRYDELMRMVRREELRRLLLVHVVQNSSTTSSASFTQTVAATISAHPAGASPV